MSQCEPNDVLSGFAAPNICASQLQSNVDSKFSNKLSTAAL